MKPLMIDAEDLIAAMQNHSGESEYFLDRQTGEVAFRFDEGIFGSDNEDFEDLLESDPDRFLYIDSVASYVGWKIMSDFCDRCTNGKAQKDLDQALAKPHPFRRFKNVLLDYPDIREQWFVFERRAMLEIARRWLEDEGISAELTINPALTNGD